VQIELTKNDLTEYDHDLNVNYKIQVLLPDGRIIGILIPSESNIMTKSIVSGNDYGLNLVTSGHYW